MGSLMYRVFGVMVLDGGTFEAIEADSKATVSAVMIVLASSLAGAIGASRSLEPRFAFITIFMTAAIVVWLGWAHLILLVSRQFRSPEAHVDLGELVRTTGFAAAPGILQVLAVIPAVATPVFICTWIWMWAAMVMAVRHSLDVQSTWRAILVCGVALALILVSVFVLTRGLSSLLI